MPNVSTIDRVVVNNARAAAPGHVRQNHSVLAAAEKRALVWMAQRLPPWVTSDHLSLLGLTAMLAAGLAFVFMRVTPWSALGVVAALAANWFGDSLDGTLARVRNQQRPRYGYYVDHVIDLAGSTFLLAGLAVSGHMSPLLALALLAGYLLVSAETYLATHTVGVFKMSFLGFGPTELRIVLGVGALYLTGDPRVPIGAASFRLFDVGGVVALAGLTFAFVRAAIWHTRVLYRAEPLPVRGRK